MTNTLMHRALADDLLDAVGRLVGSVDDLAGDGFDRYTEAIDDIVALWPAVCQFRPVTHVAA